MYVKIPQNAVDAILTPPLTLNGHMVDTKSLLCITEFYLKGYKLAHLQTIDCTIILVWYILSFFKHNRYLEAFRLYCAPDTQGLPLCNWAVSKCSVISDSQKTWIINHMIIAFKRACCTLAGDGL